MSRGHYGARVGAAVGLPEDPETQGSNKPGGIRKLALVAAALTAASLAVFAVGQIKEHRSGVSRARRAGRQSIEDLFAGTRAESDRAFLNRLSTVSTR